MYLAFEAMKNSGPRSQANKWRLLALMFAQLLTDTDTAGLDQ